MRNVSSLLLFFLFGLWLSLGILHSGEHDDHESSQCEICHLLKSLDLESPGLVATVLVETESPEVFIEVFFLFRHSKDLDPSISSRGPPQKA